MAIEFSCPRCDQKYSVSDAMAGKRVRCKQCGQERTVPGAAAPRPSPPTSAPAAAPRSRPAPPPPPPVTAARDTAPPNAVLAADEWDELPAAPRRTPAPATAPAEAPTPRPGVPGARKRKKSGPGFLPSTTKDWIRLTTMLLIAGFGAMVAMQAMQRAGGMGGAKAGLGSAILALVGLAAAGACVYSYLALMFRALGEGVDSVFEWLAFRFIPFYLLIDAMKQGDDRKKHVYTFLGGAGVLAAWCVFAWPHLKEMSGPGPKGGMAEMGPAMVASANGVLIHADGLKDEAAFRLLGKKVQAMMESVAGSKSFGMMGDGAGGALCNVEPVKNPRAFADRIDFGKVTKVDGRTISLTVNFPEEELEPIRRELAEEKARQQADQQAREQAQAQREKNDALARNPLMAGKAPDPDSPFKPKDAGDSPFKPKGNSPLDATLAELKTADGFKLRDVLKKIPGETPDDRRAEVAEAIAPLLDSSDVFTVSESIRTLGAMKCPEAAQALVPKLRLRAHLRDILEALAQLADPESAEAIADQLKHDHDAAERALIAIGPPAEAAVIPKLTDSDDGVRRSACLVLEQIGGLETLKAMQKLPADKSPFVRDSANQAMRAIISRVGPLPGDKPKAPAGGAKPKR